MAPGADKRSHERRRARRAPSHKHVLLARGGGASLLQEGTVSDISRDGLGIVTTPALPVGSSIEIEFTHNTAASASSPMFVRGRVVHVEALPNATFALGVETHVTPNVRTASPHSHPDLAPHPEGQKVTVLAPSTPPVRYAAREKRRQWVPIILVLLVPIAVGWTSSSHANGTRATARSESAQDVDAIAGRTPPPAPKPSGEQKSRAAASAPPPDAASPAALGENQLVARRSPPRTPDSSVDPALIPGMSSPMRAILKTNQVQSAQRVSADPGTSPDGSAFAKQSGKPPRTESQTPSTSVPSEGVAVVIDKSAYSLTLYRNGTPVRTVPVAVGENDTTPTGVFTVVNKLTDPIWHNRGEGVPPGDPRNPLGRRWLGLARDGRPTTYGIHAAADTSKVGQPFGDGCLRLHPEDLETVFRICPVGATVMIQP